MKNLLPWMIYHTYEVYKPMKGELYGFSLKIQVLSSFFNPIHCKGLAMCRAPHCPH